MAAEPQTIFALASAPGRAGIAVVRVSGPRAGHAVLALAPDLGSLPLPRLATRAVLYAPESISASGDRDKIDEALVLWFPGPASFTGEDVAEFHIHGGHAVLDSLITSLSGLEGLTPAGPGEFSRRAFENGKMDLTAVEAIADLVDAETSAQRRQALAQMGGALAARYDGWRERLVKSMAFAEASIDFAEEDIPDDLARQSIEALKALADEIDLHLADDGIGERIRDGFRIALTGAPNVGKSSLLNALAKRDVAIVSDIAGTTRDVIEVPLDLGGYAATLVDTAGLRDSDDAIEQEGVRRARDQAAAADLRLHLFEPGGAPPDVDADEGTLLVQNKSDLVTEDAEAPKGVIRISARTGNGLSILIGEMTARIREQVSHRAAASAPLTRARHRTALEECRAALRRAIASAGAGADEEMMAEDMRVAAQALGRITGRVDVEELLDRIFRDFCIGK
ncbi:MAG: tRNA uridine-5-carboxymethylaminomethyl(34) synthesis GTPase MnmE [Rhodospirillales bacterium]|nr:tRNA uridine-5-carboxymethylaminomethyl(34) synthesis GTPase MnmE [Rhodospirillales bacterium]MBO6787636.1 tRNA uridine-5-carboxymethylaminomethyl(34) synthesis GTPase MnmE [Rhodospirillales bacterium]